jgi:HPt (histidine-containing phosphotransfer) domain-containing protein
MGRRVGERARLEAAVRNRDREQCIRLERYSKGACASVGASAAATLLRSIEGDARDEEFDRCADSLTALAAALEDLRAEIAAF